ncbi:MAG: phosphate ABC transporter, permease protein PstA, partial [Opitutaceae bacterium]|nr:phosphate ABC transporter, permease protein PstA [Verrucomicrobiales bacterium]
MSTPIESKMFARPTPAKRAEKGVFWLLRLCTYFVLLCAVVVFLDIGLKGGSVIFRPAFPFINIPF